ncbi:PadR family transcriptional regulator [Marinoscillum sp.]|uniref:PadR family transcriptional regulator n=1 Tax=Marinoscillum sp. TaxID=2024838 RepID=UPI003BAA058D
MGKNSIGEFEEILMLTVAVLYRQAYGIAIKEEIESKLNRKVSVGAMRTALKRLEKKGLLKSELGEATAIRGGKRKRYYLVTPLGQRVLKEVMDTRKQLWDSIPDVAFDLKLI